MKFFLKKFKVNSLAEVPEKKNSEKQEIKTRVKREKKEMKNWREEG